MRQKKWWTGIGLLLAVSLLLSCSLPKREAQAQLSVLRQMTFEALLEWEREGITYACIVRWEGDRVTDVTYTAPEALCGVELTRAEEGYCLRRGDWVIGSDGEHWPGLLLPWRLTEAIRGELQERRRLEDGAEWVMREEQTGEPVTVTLGKDGALRMLSGEGVTVRVTKFRGA